MGQNYTQDELIHVHRPLGNHYIWKQPTIFWIKKSLLALSSVTEDDINIFSSVFHEDEWLSDANFVWCPLQIQALLNSNANGMTEWVRVQYPKMELYSTTSDPSNALIKAHDGTQISLEKVLTIFFTVIKKECLEGSKRIRTVISSEDTVWALTVPGMAIWRQDVVDFLKRIAYPIFGKDTAFISEAESALIGINISGSSTPDLVNGRTSIVVDLGGGTADMCVMQETLQEDGTWRFDEVKSTKGDEDPTTSKRAGGNDIEKNCIAFFFKILMAGTSYTDSYVDVYRKFIKENPAGEIDFKQRVSLFLRSDEIYESEAVFDPGIIFKRWLAGSDEPEISGAKAKFDPLLGGICFNGNVFRKEVFDPVFSIILGSLENNLKSLKDDGKTLDVLYFAGGLSLNQELRNKIKEIARLYFPKIEFKEAPDSSVIGAVQKGGNHILVNKNTLIRRMARSAFYTRFVVDFDGDTAEIKDLLRREMRQEYYDMGRWLTNEELDDIFDRQWQNFEINLNTPTPFVSYLSPLCLKYQPVNKPQQYGIQPFDKSGQTRVCMRVFSSNNSFLLFKDSSVVEEARIEHDFGKPWTKATIVFDAASSNAVEGAAVFSLLDENGIKIKEISIDNVTKRGL